MRMKHLHKLLLNNFKHNDGHLKIYSKNIFSYPKNKKTKNMLWESHTIVPKYNIDLFVEELLTQKQYKNTKVIHPYLIGLSWDVIKVHFNKKYCKSSECYELIPKDKINFKIQTRESIKIISCILGNKIFKEYFEDYYNYLSSEDGIIIEENVYIPDKEKTRFIDFKLYLSKKINIMIEINEKHHDKKLDNNRAIEIFSRTATMPILYYQNEQDMTNLLPKIYREFSYAISKINKIDGLRFHLILVDNLNPDFVDFIIDNVHKNRIEIKDIQEFLQYKYNMKNFSKYIKQLIADNYIHEDEIEYSGTNVLLGNVNISAMDKIFMRLDNKYFKDKTIPSLFCSQYSLIKNKYIKVLTAQLEHRDRHFKIIFKNRNELVEKYTALKPINSIIQEQNSYLYNNISNDIRNHIKKITNIELHPNYMFLVRQDGYFLDGLTFKKISRAVYHETEETSTNICNYRIIKQEEWNSVKNIIDAKIFDSETETETEENNSYKESTKSTKYVSL